MACRRATPTSPGWFVLGRLFSRFKHNKHEFVQQHVLHVLRLMKNQLGYFSWRRAACFMHAA
eukprot:11522954-Heterocapsa_arctica.AAC.1